MQKPPPWELTEAVHTTAIAPAGIPIIPATITNIPNSGAFDSVSATRANIAEFNDHTAQITHEFKTRTAQMPHSIERELAATRLEGTTHPLPPAQAIMRELQVRHTLIARKTAEYHQKTAVANQFFGDTPLNKNFHDYYVKVSHRRRTYVLGIADAWVVSYRAAHEANLLLQTIQLLNQQQIDVHRWLAAVQGNDQAQAAAAEAQRVAAENARIAAEQNRQRELAEAARREQEQVRAREQARLAALAEKQRRDAEQARLAAEVARINADAEARERERIAQLRIALAEAQAKAETAARELAAEQARLQAEMEQRIEAPQKQGRHPPETQTIYPASGVVASTSPHFSFASTAIRLPQATSSAILNALRSGLLTVKTSGAALFGSPVLIGFAALLMPSRLGNGDRFAMSVPFSELSSESAQTLRDIADRQGTLEMAVGLGVRPLGAGAEVFVASTDDFHIRSSVLVLNAAYDLLNDVYEVALPDSPTDFLTWTPAISPGDSSTESPVVDADYPVYSGAPIVPIEGRLDLHPVLIEGWERFIIVFPDDSGIAPLYVVFSSPYAGATTKGDYSGRDFNPEQAGGPILDLDWRTAVITQAGIDAVKLHIARLDQSDANEIMIQRLEKILSGHWEFTDTDLRYYTHEVRELERFRALGMGDDFKPDRESPLWNNAHTATLEDFKLRDDETLLYSQDAIVAADKQDELFFKNLLKGGKQ